MCNLLPFVLVPLPHRADSRVRGLGSAHEEKYVWNSVGSRGPFALSLRSNPGHAIGPLVERIER